MEGFKEVEFVSQEAILRGRLYLQTPPGLPRHCSPTKLVRLLSSQALRALLVYTLNFPSSTGDLYRKTGVLEQYFYFLSFGGL